MEYTNIAITTLTIAAIWIIKMLIEVWQIYTRRLVYFRTISGSYKVQCTPETYQDTIDYVLKTYAGDVTNIAGIKF